MFSLIVNKHGLIKTVQAHILVSKYKIIKAISLIFARFINIFNFFFAEKGSKGDFVIHPSPEKFKFIKFT